MKMIVFNSIQVTNYWFTLHCALRLLYQQAQTFSPNIQGILDQDVTLKQSIIQEDYLKEFKKFYKHAQELFMSQPTHLFIHDFI